MIYQMPYKQYQMLKHSGKNVTHQDIIDEVNNRLSLPIITQQPIDLYDEDGKFLQRITPSETGGTHKSITDVVIY